MIFKYEEPNIKKFAHAPDKLPWDGFDLGAFIQDKDLDRALQIMRKKPWHRMFSHHAENIAIISPEKVRTFTASDWAMLEDNLISQQDLARPHIPRQRYSGYELALPLMQLKLISPDKTFASPHEVEMIRGTSETLRKQRKWAGVLTIALYLKMQTGEQPIISDSDWNDIIALIVNLKKDASKTDAFFRLVAYVKIVAPERLNTFFTSTDWNALIGHLQQCREQYSRSHDNIFYWASFTALVAAAKIIAAEEVWADTDGLHVIESAPKSGSVIDKPVQRNI